MKKRILSAFMALAMCLTLLPTTAFAEGTEGGAQIREKVYSTLPEAVNAAQDGDTIKLLTDYETAEGSGEEEESGLTITKSVTLDLNGHGMDDFQVAQVNDAGETLPSGNLTVEDTSAAKTGKVTGTIELLAGNLTINGGTIGDGRDGVSIENGNLIVNGGAIDYLYGSNSGTVTINGGTVKNARFSEGFEINVTGGSGHTGLWDVSEGTWNISGGEFGEVMFKTESPAENAPISGGTFGKITRKNLQNNTETLAPISGLLADGYAFYQKTDGGEYDGYVKLTDTITSLENVQVKGHTHSCVNGICTVCKQQMAAQDNTGKYYLNLQDAFAGVANGGTVTMLTTLTGDKMISFCNDTDGHPVEKTVTLMMNGNSLSFEGAPALYVESGKLIIGDEATISQTAETAQPAVFVDNKEQGADRGTLEFKGKATLTGGLFIQNWGKLEGGLKEGTIITSNGTYSVSVERSIDTYSNVLELLGDGLAFAKKDHPTELVDGSVKQLTEDVIVVPHTTHTVGKDNKCACGYTCPHNDFKDGKCTICGNGCAHTNVGDDGVCRNCQMQMAAKVEVGDTAAYSADFKEAMKNAANGTKITLLADVSIAGRTGISGDNTTVTLDLNEHKITSGWLDVGSRDETYTTRTLKIIGKGSYEPPQYGGIITVGVKATLDLSEWEGGTISEINISDDSNHDAATREPAVIVGSTEGTIGKLSFGNNQLGELKKTKLSGGSFNEIWAAAHQPVKLGNLLADGYAYQNEDGSYVKYETKLQGASIYNVKVVKCLHPNMKPDAVTGMATCEYCGKSGKFVASVDGNLYTDMNEAISYWLENGGTLKLYTDYTATDGTWSIGSESHTVNLNGHTMSVQGDGAFFKPTNNMHLTVTDDTERGQITNILLDGNQRGSFTLESGYVGNLKMTGGAVVTLKGGSVDELDVKNCSANTNLSIQGGSLGKLNIKDWADGMHVSATGGSLGAYNLPSDKILADVLDHQYYATGTSLDRRVDTAQSWEKFVIKQAPYDFGSTSKTAEVPINGGIPFTVDSPSENVGVYDVKWYRRTNRGAEHLTENRVADVNVGDTLDVFCVITGLDRPGGAMQWQVAVKGYKLTVTKIDLANATVTIDPWLADGKFRFVPNASETVAFAFFSTITVTANGEKYPLNSDDYTYEGATATRVGKYTLTITAKDSCANFKGSKAIPWEVIPYTLHEPSFLGKQTYTKTYDGTTTLPEYTFRALFPGKGSDSEVDWREDKYKNNYEVTAAEFVSADAGENKPINQTITLKNENFVFAPTEMINIKGITTTDKTITYTNFTPIETYPTLETTFNIEKATMPDFEKEVTLDIVNDLADTYTVDLSALLPKLESPRTYGEIEYSQPTVQLASGYYTDGHAKIENGKLILTIDKNPVTTTDSIGTVTVEVKSTNYKPVTLTVNLRAVNKQRLGMFVSVATDPIVYGMTLGDIKLSAEATVGKENQVIPGTIAWEDPLTTVPSAGRATYRWTFTPDDTMHYLTASNTITFLVDKATPTGAPTYVAITTGGKTLADAPLTPNASWPTGTVQWVDKDGKPLPASTQVQANTKYTWSFTPADAANYNGATGSVTLYSVSTGGGGGGGSSSGSTVKTDTVTNPDGSVTKTETKKDGTKVETTAGKDGSVSQTTTNPNGSSVTETKAADGSTGTVKTDKHGQTTAETTLSSKAIEDAKRNGEPVKAPVEVKASRNSNTAPTVKVELPKGTGETKVEIPVSNVKPGTVAVLVHPDGTEEIVKNSLPTEDGIQLTVNGGATVKIVDNSKDFIDTRNHWAKDAIDFVSARGLVNGISATIYAPNNSATRSQLWTILARQAGADLTGGASWYEKAQAWAKDKGISDGSDPNGAITRAQMVTMLYRAAGSPEVSITPTFTDVPADSYYAKAVALAVENGITTGIGSGKFDPNGTCTRAQIATFLYRLYLSR